MQSQVLSFIDSYFGLAVLLSVAILCQIRVSGLKNEVTAPHLHFHLW
jgi:hypothetical protein